MTNIFTLAYDLCSSWLTTLANFFTEFAELKVVGLVEELPFAVPRWLEELLALLGIAGETNILSLLIGYGLFAVLAYNLVKWLVGIVTGS